MNKKIMGVVALLLAGCSSNSLPTATQAAPPAAAPGDLAEQSVTPPALPAVRYAVPPPAAATGVLIRYRSERKAGDVRPERALRLARMFRRDAADATEANQMLATAQSDPDVEFAELDHRLTASWTPDDTYLARQWSIAPLELEKAWDVTRGQTGVKVAVVDTGVDMTHADLAGNVVAGRDHANDDANPQDDQGHGTHVAGTIAAIANNAAGVAGMAPGCQVLAIKALDASGSGRTSDIIDGINEAVEAGAKVINLSLGGPNQSKALSAAIANAIAADVLVVAAAGNDGVNTRNYPAALPGVVSVGASTKAGRRASFSNHGTWVTIAAPGEDIASTLRGGRYGMMSGTSMASPHVAGVAALVRSQHPDWKVDQVRMALESTGDAVTGFNSNPALRRLNAFKAMSYSGAPGAAPTARPSAPAAERPAAPTRL